MNNTDKNEALVRAIDVLAKARAKQYIALFVENNESAAVAAECADEAKDLILELLNQGSM